MEQRSICDNGLVNVESAMKFLSMSRAKIYCLMDSGELPFGKYGRNRRIPLTALIEFSNRGIIVPTHQA